MNMIASLSEMSRERQDRYPTEIRRELPDPYGFQEIIYLGSYSYFFPQSKRRMVVAHGLIRLGDKIRETPPAVARDYLESVYHHGPRVRHEQIQKIRAGLSALPNMAKPCRFDHGFYIDIKSAFWSLMQIVGWNPDYYPEKWLCPGRPPADFPFPDHKIARNCLVSAGLISEVPIYRPPDGGSGETQRIGSKILNYSLYRLISDVLNTIAGQAESLGAVYANTDGYIAPDPIIGARIAQLIFDWGLTPRIQAEGPGGVRGSGAYKVGGNTSTPFKVRRDDRGLRKIHPRRASRWLQERIAFYSAEARDDDSPKSVNPIH